MTTDRRIRQAIRAKIRAATADQEYWQSKATAAMDPESRATFQRAVSEAHTRLVLAQAELANLRPSPPRP